MAKLKFFTFSLEFYFAKKKNLTLVEDSTFFCIYFFENDHTNYGFFFFLCNYSFIRNAKIGNIPNEK